MQGVLKASQHRFPSAAPCLWGPGPLATSRGLAACGTPAAAPRSCQRFAGSHEEAECRGEEGLRAKHLSPTPAVLCSSTCLVLAPPLEQPAAQHPPSHAPCFCSKTVWVFLVHFLSIPALRVVSPWIQSPRDAVARTTPRGQELAPSQPSPTHLQRPERPPRSSLALGSHCWDAPLLPLWESTCGKGGEKHFSATVLGKARKSGEDPGCWRVLHRRGNCWHPAPSSLLRGE